MRVFTLDLREIGEGDVPVSAEIEFNPPTGSNELGTIDVAGFSANVVVPDGFEGDRAKNVSLYPVDIDQLPMLVIGGYPVSDPLENVLEEYPRMPEFVLEVYPDEQEDHRPYVVLLLQDTPRELDRDFRTGMLELPQVPLQSFYSWSKGDRLVGTYDKEFGSGLLVAAFGDEPQSEYSLPLGERTLKIVLDEAGTPTAQIVSRGERAAEAEA